MQHDCLIFDLDGTISDPGPGIIRSINFALIEQGHKARPDDQIAALIGLPLDEMFEHLIGDSGRHESPILVDKYRERYISIGYSENTLYYGVEAFLRHVHQKSEQRLGICTSKRADVAEKILELFALRPVFDFVNGGDIGIEKRSQLKRLLEAGSITDRSLMIGDRYIDIAAAHHNGLDAAAVLWGYGSREELVKENPQYLLECPTELNTLQQQ
tara:strand:+ start:886 stop:1527 length:642 start_codon:yes stop_codon:yes gene_type:complete